MSDSKKLRNTKILSGFLGILFLAGAVWCFNSTSRFLETAQPAVATVIAIELELPHAGGSNTSSEIPVVQFRAATRELVEAKASFGSGGLLGGYEIGEELSILYDPQEPENFCEAGWFGVWGATIALFILGLSFIAGALFGKLVER